MEVTHWLTTVTHALQQGTQFLTATAHSLPEVSMPATVHELSITALAAAVVTLGCVMLLELRALAALRRNVDSHLERVFEQLDLIRYDHVQLLEAYARHAGGLAAAVATGARSETAITASATATSASVGASFAPAAIAAGEARLLASLAEARARRTEAIRAAAAARPAAATR